MEAPGRGRHGPPDGGPQGGGRVGRGTRQTPVTYLDREHPKGSSRGFLWVYHSPATREVLFDWRTTREHGHLERWLGPDYAGILQADGYARR